MLLYASKRVVDALVTLLAVATLTFFAIRLAPGGPFDSERAYPPEVQANIEAKYELDRPVLVQFTHWLEGLAHGDLRQSFQYEGQPIAKIVQEALPVSLELGVLALTFALSFGLFIGCLAAWKRGTWVDSSAVFLAVSGASMPSYLAATILIEVFAIHLGWLPPALWESWSSAVLPVAALGFRPMALVARLARSSMMEALASDYIRTAHAKGVFPASVVFKHALRNSLIPVLSLLGPIAASLLTGSFLVETVFQIPGLGKYFVTAVINRDYPLVMGVTLAYGVALVSSNLVIDLLSSWADPRIRIWRNAD